MNNTQKKIFREAKELFETQGYYATTVREITDAAGVNSGLFNYYFKNKYNLAVKMYDNMFQNIKTFTDEYFVNVKNPAVFMGIMMRMHTYTINDPISIKFTIDALKEGIFEASLIKKSHHQLVSNINNHYNTKLTKEKQKILLSITLGAERAMITQNYNQIFQIESKTIADNILRVHLFGYGIENEEISRIITRVQENFKKLLADKPDFVKSLINY